MYNKYMTNLLYCSTMSDKSDHHLYHKYMTNLFYCSTMSDKSDRHLYHKYETLNMSKMSGGGHSPPLSRATSPLNHDYESGKANFPP